VYGQGNTGKSRILIIAQSGRSIFVYNDSILAPFEFKEIINNSKNELAIKYYKRYRRRYNLSQVFIGIGGGAGGIWLINELANDEFHNVSDGTVLWYKTVVLSTVINITIGSLIFKNSKRQFYKSVEEYNKSFSNSG